MKRIIILLVAIILLSSCVIDPNLSGEVQLTWDDSGVWMSLLRDDILLRKITIPGTHDTCANYDFMRLSSTAAAQDLSLEEQLLCGVRYVDLRPCYEEGKLIIRHGVADQKITFERALSIITDFLETHPSETVIAAILPEYTDENDYSHSYEYLKTLDSNQYIKGADITDYTLADCRGKVIIVSRDSVESSMRDVFCNGYRESGAKYKISDLEYQWETIKEALETDFSAKVTAVYTSGYFEGQFGIPNIRIASSFINPRLKYYLETHKNNKPFGIIVTDHITKNLAHEIYSCNQ